MTATPRFAAAFLWLGSALAGALDAGQAAPPHGQEAEVPSEDLEAERALAGEELGRARQALEAYQDAAPPDALVQEVDVLQRLELLLGQRLAARGVTRTTGEELARIDLELSRLRISGPDAPRPFEFELLDAVLDELRREEARAGSLQTTLASASSAVDQARQQSDARGAAWRRAKEDAELDRDEGRAAALATALRLADLERRVAEHRLDLRERELRNARDQVDLHERRLEFLREKLSAVRRETVLSEAELARKLGEIDLSEDAHRTRLGEIDPLLSSVLGARLDAEGRLMEAMEEDPALIAERDLRDTESRVLQEEKLFLAQVLEHAQLDRVAWQRRAALSGGTAEGAEHEEWRAEAVQALRDLEHDRSSFDAALDGSRTDFDQAEAAYEASSKPSRQAGWLRARRTRLRDHQAALEELRESTERSIVLHGRLLVELGEQEPGFELGRSVARAWSGFLDVWDYEVAAVEDRPITVGKIATGILLITLGFWASRIFSGRFVYWVLQRFHVNEGASAAIRSLVFYALVLTCALFALRVVNVPLTAFTILGGALAIGVGFGSQNIVNNFISGLILLAERPISVGDMIQIDDLTGTVEYIGARSTRVRTGENVELLVPNSSFLESNVVNWTFSDRRIRAHVTVGVAYGSPTREVQKLLLRAAEEHGQVLDKPERPFVTFDDFGESALAFTVHFWIEIRRLMDRRRIESDLRFIVDSLFREAGITLAFPQRDVHLDSRAPLAVRIERTESGTNRPD